MNKARCAVAEAALSHLSVDQVLGVGSGRTVEHFIQAMAKHPQRPKQAVASSLRTAKLLRAIGIEVLELNDIDHLALYIDGADVIDQWGHCLKGGGGALTREKILADLADRFVCLVDTEKVQPLFHGDCVLTVEVLPMARSAIARRLVALGGNPSYRVGFVTDNQHILLDVVGLDFEQLADLDRALNQWPGLIAHGLFYQQSAHLALVGEANGRVQPIDFTRKGA